LKDCPFVRPQPVGYTSGEISELTVTPSEKVGADL